MSGGRVDLAPIIGARVKPAAQARHHGGRADLAPIPPVQSSRRPRTWSVTRVRGASSSNAGWCQSPRMGGVRMHEVDAEATGAGGGECVTWDTTELHPHVEIGQLVEKYGFRFTWTALHRTGAELAPYRQIGDDLADALLASVRCAQWHFRAPTETTPPLPAIALTLQHPLCHPGAHLPGRGRPCGHSQRCCGRRAPRPRRCEGPAHRCHPRARVVGQGSCGSRSASLCPLWVWQPVDAVFLLPGGRLWCAPHQQRYAAVPVLCVMAR